MKFEIRKYICALLTLAFVNCFSYEVRPNSAIAQIRKPQSNIPKNAKVIDFGDQDTQLQLSIRKALASFNQSTPPIGLNSEPTCQISIQRAPQSKVHDAVILATLTLGLIPVYRSYENFAEILFECFRNNKRLANKTYHLGSSAWLWLPFIVSGFWDGEKFDATVKEMAADFFYNELPKIQDTAQ